MMRSDVALPELSSTEAVNLQHLINSILCLCAKGFAVFPLLPGKKTPATPNGYKAATTDPVKAVAMFGDSHLNIGIATGESNLVVLDVDGEPGRESLHKLAGGDAPLETMVVSTRRGCHWYFEMPTDRRIGCSVGRVGAGLDIRGDGGYVVGPTSWVDADEKGPAARYRIISPYAPAPIPEWLLSALDHRSSMPDRKINRGALRHRVPNTPRNIASLDVLLMVVSADCSYELWRNVVWGILATGWSDAETRAREWSESAPHRFDESGFKRLVADFDPERFSGDIIQMLRRTVGEAK